MGSFRMLTFLLLLPALFANPLLTVHEEDEARSITSAERRGLEKYFNSSAEIEEAELHEEEAESQGILLTDINEVMAKAEKIVESEKQAKNHQVPAQGPDHDVKRSSRDRLGEHGDGTQAEEFFESKRDSAMLEQYQLLNKDHAEAERQDADKPLTHSEEVQQNRHKLRSVVTAHDATPIPEPVLALRLQNGTAYPEHNTTSSQTNHSNPGTVPAFSAPQMGRSMNNVIIPPIYDAQGSDHEGASKPGSQDTEHETAGKSVSNNFDHEIARPVSKDFDHEVTQKPVPKDFDHEVAHTPVPIDFDHELTHKPDPKDFDHEVVSTLASKDFDHELAHKSVPKDFDHEVTHKPVTKDFDHEVANKLASKDFDHEAASQPAPMDFDHETASKPGQKTFDHEADSRPVAQFGDGRSSAGNIPVDDELAPANAKDHDEGPKKGGEVHSEEAKLDNELIPKSEKPAGALASKSDSSGSETHVEVRTHITPMSSPYLILASPFVFTGPKQSGLVIPAYMFHFRNSVPAYISFGKIQPGAEKIIPNGDDPTLTKESFFRDPEGAMANFHSDFLKPAKAQRHNPAAMIRQMRMETSKSASHFPLDIFKGANRHKGSLKVPTNVFDFMKTVQPKPLRYPDIYMSS